MFEPETGVITASPTKGVQAGLYELYVRQAQSTDATNFMLTEFELQVTFDLTLTA